MFALPVRSMLYPNEQLPAYTPRWDPETSSVLSSAPSYTSAAPSYHSAVPPFHTSDGEVVHANQQDARSSWYLNNGSNNSDGNSSDNNSNSQIQSRYIFNLNSNPASTSTTRSQTNETSQQRNENNSNRLPAPSFAPGFESRALFCGNPSESQLRLLYNTSSWVSMNSGLQSRAYENVARRRAQQAKAEAVLLRSAAIHGGLQSITDVSRLENIGRQRSNSNMPAAATTAAAAAVVVASSSRDPAIAVTPSIEAARSPVSNALYGLVNASAVSVAPTLREEPITRATTPTHRDSSAEPSAQTPEEDDHPLSPHEDPFLVGEEAATRARNQRLYITSQTQENQLHGIWSTVASLVPDAILGASRPATPFAGDRSRPRRQTDAGTTSSTAHTAQYTSLVEQGLQARAQRSRSASTSNVTSTAVSSSTTTTRSSQSGSVNGQQPSLTASSRSRSSSTSPSSSPSTLLTPQTPVFRRTSTSASVTTSTYSSFLSPSAPSIKLTSTSCTNLLPVTPEADEEHLQVINPVSSSSSSSSSPPPRPTTVRWPSTANDEGPFPLSSFLPSSPLPHHCRGSLSPGMNDSPIASSTYLPQLTPSLTAPQVRTQRSDDTDSSASESNGRVSPAQEALLIAQESKQWDFMMSQMADWEERQRTWKKFRDDMERKFCSGRRLGLHGIIGWSPFHGHSKSAKKEEKGRGRKRAISSGAQTSGSWRRRVVGRPV